MWDAPHEEAKAFKYPYDDQIGGPVEIRRAVAYPPISGK